MPTEKFHWTAPSGADITLPRASQIKAGLLRKIRKMNETDAMFVIFEEVCDEPTLAAIDDLTVQQLNDLAEAWQKEGSLGESSGSSTSSTPTGEPSSTTSEPVSTSV